MLTREKLADLVKQMRDAQAAYFLARRSTGRDAREELSRSKQLERMVDQAVAEILEGQGRLPGMD